MSSSTTDDQILDYIDRGYYDIAKSAITDKIRKNPNKIYFKILLNKIIYKSESTELAIKNNLQLLQSLSNDTNSILLLNEFFTDLEMEKEADLCFENIIKKYPIKSIEICFLWFNNCIESGDLKKFNKIFSYLNKSKLKKYQYWYSFSFYLLIKQLQQLSNPTDEEISKLKLYKSFGKKLIENEKFVNCQQVYVYTRFLILDEDYQSIENVLNQIEFPLDLELQILYLETLDKNENWLKLFEYNSNLLFNDKFDDFNTYKLWIKSGKQLGKTYEELKEKLGDSRNELLVKIELSILFGVNIEEDANTYYNKFQNKLCCYPDLSKYQLPSSFYDKIKESSNLKTDNAIVLVNNQKFAPQTVNSWQYYNKIKTERSEYDNDPLNELFLVSIEKQLQIPTYENIISNIIIINNLLIQDKYNYKLKILLIKLYSNLNNNNLIISIYQSLKIKMIQHDTLNYLLTNSLPSKISLEVYIEIFKFYLTSFQEIKETIYNGFDFEIYNKLESFINFNKRLKNSISLFFIVYKILQTSIITNDKGYIQYFNDWLIKNEKLILNGEWRDNRDFSEKSNVQIIVDDTTSIRIKLIIYMMINEINNENKLKYLLKNYNKLISNSKNFTPWSNLIYKIYYNIFKIKTKINENETKSLINFILKNLKFDKLKNYFENDDIISSKTNQKLIELVELINIIKFIFPKSNNSDIKLLFNQLTNLTSELKNENFIINSQLSFINQLNLNLPINDIDSTTTLNEIKESIIFSTKSILNNLK
ncbi:MDM20 [Candida pseudojiufengensis]|uniref:MDM20 n=1 Tax=Candida pseudojiufengensis TaxID=497109 RepID=UPI002225273A|nr:MDM20 [Candida pseudojiufengensis]KAI5966511.1 MDM20 [Candida pseudojiufengensis]